MVILTIRYLRVTGLLLTILILLTGLVYPLLVTFLAQTFFPYSANGSLLKMEGRTVGSSLIGQPFSDNRYFWGRLSATLPFPYTANASSGTNSGPLSPDYINTIQRIKNNWKTADPDVVAPIPIDLITASGSGLDPDISLEAALYQAHRVALARGLPIEGVISLINQLADHPLLSIIGTPRINVLRLNLALDSEVLLHS